ncbi:MAG: tetratricopeptide repeat protein [Spirochaetales bacterium]|nr:tetratricopeptide repeat protein [Spirochaetales bacterium]
MERSIVQKIFTFIKNNKLPIIIFIVAFIARFIYLIDYSHSPFFQVHIADALYHEEWARNILHGDIFSLRPQGVFYKAPFYPYFVAFIYFISGNSDFLLMFVQVIMSSFNCVLIFLIGRNYFNDIAAFIGAIMYNFYFPSIFYSTEMEIPALAVFLTLVSFYLLIINKRTLYIILSSIIFGFSIVTLPTNLLLLPFYVFLLFKKQGMKLAVILTVITFATIFPCTLRNSITGKHFTLVSANGGINFYLGNNEDYDETVYLQPGYAFEEFYDEPRREEGVDSFADRDRYWYKKAFEFIFHNPVKEMFLIVKKFVLYFSDYEILRNRNIYYAKDTSLYKYIPFFPSSFILATGLAGLFLVIYKKRNITLIIVCIILSLPCIIFFVTSRYRLPSMCIWTVFSGFCFTFVVDLLKNKKWLAVTITIAAVVCIVILSNLNIFVIKNPGYRPYFNLGFIYEEKANYNRALEEYSKSLTLIKQELPFDFKTGSEVYARIGNIYMKLNKLAEAEENFYKAIEINPDSYPAYSYLGTLYSRKKENDMAITMYNKAIEIYPRDVVSVYSLGLFYLENNLFDEAIIQFKRAIELYPEHSGAHSNLAYIYGMQGKFDLMEEYAKKAILYNPEETPARYNLAALYLNTGRTGEAIEQYKKIIHTTPHDSGNAYNQLGVIYARENELKKAIQYWKKALEIEPDHENAKANLRRAREIIGQ